MTGATLNRLFPNFTPGASANFGGMSTTGAVAQSTNGSERRPSGTLNLTEVHGNHTVKYGAEWREDRYPVSVFTNTAGNYSFTSAATVPNGSGVTADPALQVVSLSQGTTGFGYANFLLGGVQAVTIAVPAVYRSNKYQWSVFAQDSWKVTRKLTVDYGLRWDYGTYTREDYGRLGDLSLTTPNSSAGGLPGGLIFEANCNCSFAHNYPFAIGPRLGFAYSYDPKTVVRGGVGVVYNSTQWFGAGISNQANGPAAGLRPVDLPVVGWHSVHHQAAVARLHSHRRRAAELGDRRSRAHRSECGPPGADPPVVAQPAARNHQELCRRSVLGRQSRGLAARGALFRASTT